MRRSCQSCDREYEARRPNSRFCSESCRKKASRAGNAENPPDSAENAPGTTRMRVHTQLEGAGRLETWEGACALALADRIDQSTSVMGYAALIKQLGDTMDRALDGVKRAVDPLDELKARRDSKRAG